VLRVLTAIDVTHFTDPGCPWAYSASPALSTLRWRYGDQLRWTLVTIGLAEDPALYEQRGYTPLRSAIGYMSFRRFGMPLQVMAKAGLAATSSACRAIVATRLAAPQLELAAFRALQFAHANLDPTLERRPPAEDPVVVLAAFEHPLATAEIAAIMAEHLAEPRRAHTERALLQAVADGRAVQHPVGDDALWSLAG